MSPAEVILFYYVSIIPTIYSTDITDIFLIGFYFSVWVTLFLLSPSQFSHSLLLVPVHVRNI